MTLLCDLWCTVQEEGRNDGDTRGKRGAGRLSHETHGARRGKFHKLRVEMSIKRDIFLHALTPLNFSAHYLAGQAICLTKTV